VTMALNRSKMIVVMVTGAGSGIGRATVLHLATQRVAVGVVDCRTQAAESTAAEVRQRGGQALPVVCDVREVRAVYEAVARIEESLGPLTAQVNCAGVWQTRDLLEITEEDWDLVMGVNARGLFFCVQAAGRAMLPRKLGAIVNISSVGGRVGRPLQAHYAASKAAVISITHSAAIALGPHGVRVNAVCPGVIDTPMWAQVIAERARREGKADPSAILERVPLGRVGTPEEVAAVTSFLISEEASYINGQCLNVCGGMETD